mmetsp:Transcript_23353/g.65123  ORF Transcript_23353/g.65123 Transcript_23353/m.65123 type:complete len:286 (-) Transcript_23353:63-920(-)
MLPAGHGTTTAEASSQRHDGAPTLDLQKPRDLAEAERMLRNYRLRRRLGLLPELSGAALAIEGTALRWVRQSWRPRQLVAERRDGGEGEEVGDSGCAATDAGEGRGLDAVAEVADLQHRVERSYSELNAERRAHAALAEGLRRQGESVEAITAEAARLRAQLDDVRRELQDRTAVNGQLSTRLGLQRQNQASSLTQAAVLTSAVNRLIGPAGASSRNGTSASSYRADLALLRAQTTALAEENSHLERMLCPERKGELGSPGGGWRGSEGAPLIVAMLQPIAQSSA